MSSGHLAITVKIGEHFTIGEDIRVNLVEKRGSQILLCVEAPKHLIIMRSSMKNPRRVG